MIEEAIFILDKIGIVAFAFAGVSAGVKKKLDLFGLVMIGTLTAVAGGIIRDLILERTPYAISNIDYLLFAFLASIGSIVFYHFKIRVHEKSIHVADSIGLGVFAATGSAVALSSGLSVLHSVFFAIITAVGGGIIRDIILNQIPFIMKKEVYATAAGIGGVASYIFFMMGYDLVFSTVMCMVVTLAVRIFAVQRKLNLPVIK